MSYDTTFFKNLQEEYIRLKKINKVLVKDKVKLTEKLCPVHLYPEKCRRKPIEDQNYHGEVENGIKLSKLLIVKQKMLEKIYNKGKYTEPEVEEEFNTTYGYYLSINWLRWYLEKYHNKLGEYENWSNDDILDYSNINYDFEEINEKLSYKYDNYKQEKNDALIQENDTLRERNIALQKQLAIQFAVEHEMYWEFNNQDDQQWYCLIPMTIRDVNELKLKLEKLGISHPPIPPITYWNDDD